MYTFAWTPVLIDYASIARHEIEGLVGPLTDGDYIARNFLVGSRIAFVDDSDEITYASWTPAALGAREFRRSILQRLPMVGRALRCALLRRAYFHYTRDYYPFGDHVKVSGFRIPLKLHTSEIDLSWELAIKASQDELAHAVGDLLEPPTALVTSWTLLLDRLIPVLKSYEAIQWIVGSLRFIKRRLIAAARGDEVARAWIRSRIRARLG